MLREVVEHYTPIKGYSNKICCPIHGENTPSFTIYDDTDSWYCFGACSSGGDVIEFVKKMEDVSFSEAKSKVLEILDITEEEYEELKEEAGASKEIVATNPAMDKKQVVEFIRKIGYESNNYRSIRDDISQFFGHLTELDSDGNVKARYYPETNHEGLVSGYKCRNHPKDFTHGNVGVTGSKSQLSGQVKFKSGGKYVLIVGGEEDKAAAYQMLLDSQNERNQKDYNAIAVVSPTTGEGSAAKQVAAQYHFLDSFDIIVIGMDNDAAGKAAAEKVAAVLPKEKVRLATWSGKDPNQMLEQGKQRQFVRDFYGAKEFYTSGILSSTEMMPHVIEELMRPRIKLPEYMKKLEEATGGGIQQGRIVNVIGDTSAGKSTHVNGMVYYWMFNAPEKVGVVSLEATAGQYSLDMLSLHLETNLAWFGTGMEIVDHLNKPEVMALYENLWTNEYGEPRWAILDERDGDIKNLENQIERLVSQFGCKIIVIDVLTDILRSLPIDKQEEHMKWQKVLIKRGITIINVLHTRKPPQNADGTSRRVTEYDALGSGTFVQSAAINIVINRDKMAEGDEKNITYVDLPKCRGGKTGEVGKWFYDWNTRRCYDYDEWLSKQDVSF